METAHEYGRRLRALREKCNLSVKAVSTITGCHIMSLYRIEAGGRLPSIHLLADLAMAYGVTIETIVPPRTENPPKKVKKRR